jgi:hypothetical protein
MPICLRVEDVGVGFVFWREEEDESKGWVFAFLMFPVK